MKSATRAPRARYTITYDEDFDKLVISFLKFLNDKREEPEHELREPDLFRIALVHLMQEEGFFRYLEKYDPELYAKTQGSEKKGE